MHPGEGFRFLDYAFLHNNGRIQSRWSSLETLPAIYC